MEEAIAELRRAVDCSPRARGIPTTVKPSARRVGQPLIEGDKGDRLAQLSRQVETTRKLDGVAGAEWMPHEERSRLGGDVRRHLHDGHGGKIALQGGQHPTAARWGDRSLSGPADYR